MHGKKLSIVIAICTCQRGQLLEQVLASINDAEYYDKCDIHVCVVDNHISKSASAIVDQLSNFKYPLNYISEPQAGIPFARNAAIEWGLERNMDACIFIDDDEIAHDKWLVRLLDYYLHVWPQAQVVTGPVESIFTAPYPAYFPKDIHNKKRLKRKTGEVLYSAYTNNVIFDLAICKQSGLRFDETLHLCGGTDSLFFKRVAEYGYKIVWCCEAFLYEQIDKDRLSLLWLIKRHARHGVTFVHISKRLDTTSLKQYMRCIFEILYAFISIGKKLLIKHPKYSITYLSIGLARCAGIVMGLLGMRVNEYKSRHK